MKRSFIPVALCLAVAACSRSEEAESRTAAAVENARTAESVAASSVPASTASLPKIVFLGDSLTAGLGLEQSQAVPSLVQARLDADGYRYEVVNAGVSGDTSAGGLRRLEWSLDGDVRVLVVELGANDGLRGLPIDQMKKNLEGVIQTATSRGVKVLLTGMEAPPNYGPVYTAEFRRVYQDLAETPGVTFMPFYLEGVAGISALNQRDGIHPNSEGARIVERNLWRALEPMLDKPSTR